MVGNDQSSNPILVRVLEFNVSQKGTQHIWHFVGLLGIVVAGGLKGKAEAPNDVTFKRVGFYYNEIIV